MLNTVEACVRFVESEPPSVIAAQLRADQQICHDAHGFPSLLVHYLPSPSSPASTTIALALNTDGERIPPIVARMRLAGIVQGIKAYLATMHHEIDTDTPIPQHLIPSDDDLRATLKVLQYLQLPPATNLDVLTPLKDVVATVQSQLDLGTDVRAAQLSSPPSVEECRPHWSSRKCYICFFVLASGHPLYPSLCRPCGDFNTASSALSLPPQLNLTSKTALVTGARINLGYHTTLRLLRCGSSVIVTTRYPHDAETRYLNETDSATWKARLRIIGADFRTAKDVFSLVRAVKECLCEWNTEKLDVLVNNAAQTLTDRVEVEKASAEREAQLRIEGAGDLVVDVGYAPCVRGGVGAIEYGSNRRELLQNAPGPDAEQVEEKGEHAILIQSVKSSWTQKLGEIPYEDVISTHSINAFVPLILMRELLPIMSSSPSPSSRTKPSAYIINVSSREGIPEKRPSHSAKAGHHVHNNMSKAALNMLTETEASEAWRHSRVAINSVDPGFMSADPQWMKMVGRADMDCPIGWEDGAGRVLWPVALGEKGEPVWGRFLKHFQSIDLGRK